MFEDELIEQAKEKKHMTASQAAYIAKMADVKRMCLIHYSPRYTDKELYVLLEQAQKIYPKTELSKDRMHIEIPFED
jgi:ribonuclease Z